MTLVKRAVRGEKVWEAHRTHFYQRLVQMGWSHRKLALAEYALMAATAVSALVLRNAHSIAVSAMLLIWAGLYAAIAIAIDRRWVRFCAK